MTTSRLIDGLTAYNTGRVPALLARKYQRMAADPFAFFRGTVHLFHADFPKGLGRFPAVWLNGDLHLENFGTYRGDNRLTYFDLGDFDEGALGPASRDLLRFLAGLHLAMPLLHLPARMAERLAGTYLAAYVEALAAGKAYWLERRLAGGLIGDLMFNLERRQIDDGHGSPWLRSRVGGGDSGGKNSGGKNSGGTGEDYRFLRLDSGKFLTPPPDWRRQVERAVTRIGRQHAQDGGGHWTILDIAWRVAGLGTLGLPRFCTLIRVAPPKGTARHGKRARTRARTHARTHDGERPGGAPGAPPGEHRRDQPITTEGDLLLLDLKAQPGSALSPYLREKQPRFASEAERIVAIETRLQAVPPALLTAVEIGGRSFTLRELQPEADKLDLAKILEDRGRLDPEALLESIVAMGRLTAWAHLRSAGRQGSATADDLIAFAGKGTWAQPLRAAAIAAARRTTGDWRQCRDWLTAEARRLTSDKLTSDNLP